MGFEPRPPCFLTVDLEDRTDARLAALAAARGVSSEPFDAGGTERLLDLFAAHGARATFFVLGSVAARAPALVQRIARDHEVATHGATHTDLRSLDAPRLGASLRDARRRLEDLTGRAVLGYRSPNWSLAAVLSWALPVVEAAGFVYDSSLLPGRGLLFLPGAGVPRAPHPIPGSALWEFPPTVLDLGWVSFPAAGGAFLRLLPEGLARLTVAGARRRGETPHLHVHPWELSLRVLGGARLASRLERLLKTCWGTAIGDRFETATDTAGRAAA